MVSQRRAAQLGLLAATLVLMASFGVLVSQSGEKFSQPANAAGAPGATQAPALTFSLSAPAHSSDTHLNP